MQTAVIRFMDREDVARQRREVESEPEMVELDSGDAALEQRVVAALRSVYDPEIPVNIYDLGLIYVVHIDAHADLREEFDGNPLSHACAMARCLESVSELRAVGIRSYTREEADRIESGIAKPIQRAMADVEPDLPVGQIHGHKCVAVGDDEVRHRGRILIRGDQHRRVSPQHLAQGCQFVAGVGNPGGIGRAVDHHQPGAVGDGGFQPGRRDLEAGLGAGRDHDGFAIGQQHRGLAMGFKIIDCTAEFR